MGVVGGEQTHLGAGLRDDPADVLGRIGGEADLTPDVLGGPETERPQPVLVPGKSVKGCFHLSQPRRHPDGSLLDHADPQGRETFEDPVEDHGGQGLSRWPRDPHVVDRPEILLPSVEIGRNGKSVVEVMGVDQVSRAPDMEDDRNAGVLDAGPHRVQPHVARGVSGRTTRGHQHRCRPHRDHLVRHGRRLIEVDKGDITSREEAVIDRAELHHGAVVGAGRTVGELEIGRVLPVAQPAIVEGVEHQLAGEAEKVEGPRAVFGDERPRGGEVLPCHDLGRLVAAILLRGVHGAEPVERRNQVAGLLVGVARLPEFVASRVPKWLDPVPDTGIGVIAEPCRSLHDMGIGIVRNSPAVVRHGIHLPGPFDPPQVWRMRLARARPDAKHSRNGSAVEARRTCISVGRC